MSEQIKILLVEDTLEDAELLLRELRKNGLDVAARRVDSGAEFEAELNGFAPDVILSDYSLPGFGGMKALEIASRERPDTPFIFVSGTIGEERAIEALKLGATDYVLKDKRGRLASSIKRALKEREDHRIRLEAEGRLRDSEERFRSVAEATQEWIWEADSAVKFTYSNSAVDKILGYAPSSVPGTSLMDYIHEEERPAAAELFGNIAADRRPRQNVVLRWRHRDGAVRWMESTAFPLLDAGGRMIGYRGANRDVTERIHQQERIARLSRIHAVLSGINSSIVRVHDRGELFRDFCRVAGEDGGFRIAWIGLAEGKSADLPVQPQAWVGVEHMPEPDAALRRMLSEDRDTVEQVLRTGDVVVVDEVGPGRFRQALEPRFRSLAALPLLVEGEAVGVAMLYAAESGFFDHEELKLLRQLAADISFALDHFSKKERLNYLAHYDPLTSLPNRALFLERLTRLIGQEEVVRQGQVAVVALDLERFRNINDTLGRDAGDALLREVAQRLYAVIPDTGFLARINADCFAFVVKESRSDKNPADDTEWEFASRLTALQRKIVARFVEAVHLPDKDIRISVRSGIALFPTDGSNADALLRNAEAALNDAKKSKLPYLFYTAEMNARAAEKLSIENRLRRALGEKQFVLHYQPKIDLASRKIVGMEALIRWNEPGTGLMRPAGFIAVLEETGLIAEAGTWVIAEARRQYREWQGLGLAVPRIAVNVSELQIRRKDFVADVLDMLGPEGAAGIEFEITESLFMENIDENIAKLETLRRAGLTVGIDDFGTGYSSLSYIARLPIDTLKIDQSFITDITSSNDHLAIVSSIISLAHQLDLKVVAEGVDTVQQAALLATLHCDQIQGHVCSPALPPERMQAMLAAGEPCF